MNLNIKIIGLAFIGVLLIGCVSKTPSKDQNQSIQKDSMLYFGQDAPANTPVVFAPGLISKPDRYEFGCTFSKDGKELFFGVSNGQIMEIHHTSLKNNQWSDQVNIFPNDSCSYNDPMFSLDEQRLYFISNRPIEAKGKLKDIDLWYIERFKADWSAPINLGSPINNHLDQYYSSFTSDGSIYFASKDTVENAPRHAFDIYKAPFINGHFNTPEKLPAAINTPRYEADVFIAPDESYMIFCSIRKDGLGNGDLYISFKNEHGAWTKAISMGPSINTAEHELCPYVTPDGKFFFYTSNEDLYWVSTGIFKNFRKL